MTESDMRALVAASFDRFEEGWYTILIYDREGFFASETPARWYETRDELAENCLSFIGTYGEARPNFEGSDVLPDACLSTDHEWQDFERVGLSDEVLRAAETIRDAKAGFDYEDSEVIAAYNALGQHVTEFDF